MVNRILSSGQAHGIANGDSLHSPVPSTTTQLAPVLAPRLIFSTYNSGPFYYDIDGERLSPVFNKNSAICGEVSAIVDDPVSKRVFIISSVADSERIRTMTIAELDVVDLKVGKFSPRVLSSQMFSLRSTPISNVQWLVRAVPKLSEENGDPTFVIHAYQELVKVQYDRFSVSRVRYPPYSSLDQFNLSGHAPAALVGNAANNKVFVNLRDMTVVDVVDSPGDAYNWIPFYSGFYYAIPSENATHWAPLKNVTSRIRTTTCVSTVTSYSTTTVQTYGQRMAVTFTIPYDSGLMRWEYQQPAEYSLSTQSEPTQTGTLWCTIEDQWYRQPTILVGGNGGYQGGDWSGSVCQFLTTTAYSEDGLTIIDSPWFLNQEEFPSSSQAVERLLEMKNNNINRLDDRVFPGLIGRAPMIDMSPVLLSGYITALYITKGVTSATTGTISDPVTYGVTTSAEINP